MPEDVRRLVGANVRRLRIAAGLKSSRAARAHGRRSGLRQRLGKGRRNPTIITLWQLAKALSDAIR
jgi:hypothetical protein